MRALHKGAEIIGRSVGKAEHRIHRLTLMDSFCILRGMEWLREAIDRADGHKRVADLCGLSRTHLKNLYRGVRPLTPETVAALQPHLDVPSEQWFEALTTRQNKRRRVADGLHGEAPIIAQDRPAVTRGAR